MILPGDVLRTASSSHIQQHALVRVALLARTLFSTVTTLAKKRLRLDV